MDKPDDMGKYKEWLTRVLHVTITDEHRSSYDTVTRKMHRDLIGSPFWSDVRKQLDEYHDAYQIEKKSPLFLSRSPEVVIKPFDSFLLKSYRRNVVDNKKWPEQPTDGWILPTNWYTRINDVLRTLLVVKYVDGVQYTAGNLRGHFGSMGLPCHTSLEARDEGYYAGHVYVEREYEIPGAGFSTSVIHSSLEIQVTTQVQDVIRRLLHTRYEQVRSKPKRREMWQWQLKSDEFSFNYLGHILHYLEGMILETRDKQNKTLP